MGFLNQKYLGRKLTSSLVEAPSKNEENNICQISSIYVQICQGRRQKGFRRIDNIDLG